MSEVIDLRAWFELRHAMTSLRRAKEWQDKTEATRARIAEIEDRWRDDKEWMRPSDSEVQFS